MLIVETLLLSMDQITVDYLDHTSRLKFQNQLIWKQVECHQHKEETTYFIYVVQQRSHAILSH